MNNAIRKIIIILISGIFLPCLLFSQLDKKEKKFLVFAADGDSSKVEKYLQKGIPVNTKNRSKWTALAYASKYGHLGTVKVLIHNGADIDMAVNIGSTPLHLALNNKHYQLAEYLILKGASVNLSDLTGMTPLAWAAKQGDIRAVKLLVNHGADVNSKNVSSRTVLDNATNEQVKKYLKSKGAKTSNGLM